nr:uncharacterized protein LOC116765315 [Danaus plexippus plexippus]
MSTILNRLEVENGKLGLGINRQKTKLMIVDRALKLSNAKTILGIEKVGGFVYLGSKICDDGSCVPVIQRRMGMGNDAMTHLQNIWRNRGIGFNTISRLVRAFVFPIFLYGAETWTVRARERQKIDAFEMWCRKRILKNTMDRKTHKCFYSLSTLNQNSAIHYML